MTVREYLQDLFEPEKYFKFYEMFETGSDMASGEAFREIFGFSLEDDYIGLEDKVSNFVDAADTQFFCLSENFEDTVDKMFIIPMLKSAGDITYIKKFFNYDEYFDTLIDSGYMEVDGYIFAA